MPTEYEHVYAHFPFCDVICHYCDFYTARSASARHEDFFKALIRESELALPRLKAPLKALYLGGGTPSVSPPNLLAEFLHVFRRHTGAETEITLEANPTNVNPESVAAWAGMGINRISLGVQSLDDSILKRLGRMHSADEALNAIAMVKARIANVSGDLIYGVPGQEKTAPALHGQKMAEMGATHISAYHLTLEAGHFMYPKLPEDVFAWEQIRELTASLEERGFSHYEVSNFAMAGHESRNNSNYWAGGPYWALGPSAHGFDGDLVRWKNLADWEKYVEKLQRSESPIAERETLQLEQRKIEVLFTSLRTRKGLHLESFARRFQGDFLRRNKNLLERWEKDGLGTLANGHFVLTFEGKMLADEMVRQLI